MENANLQSLDALLNYVLLSVGMATISGVGAKLLVPGPKRSGTFSTLIIGFASTALSVLTLKYLYERLWNITDFNPFQFLTLVLSVLLGALGLFLYRSITDLFG